MEIELTPNNVVYAIEALAILLVFGLWGYYTRRMIYGPARRGGEFSEQFVIIGAVVLIVAICMMTIAQAIAMHKGLWFFWQLP